MLARLVLLCAGAAWMAGAQPEPEVLRRVFPAGNCHGNGDRSRESISLVFEPSFAKPLQVRMDRARETDAWITRVAMMVTHAGVWATVEGRPEGERNVLELLAPRRERFRVTPALDALWKQFWGRVAKSKSYLVSQSRPDIINLDGTRYHVDYCAADLAISLTLVDAEMRSDQVTGTSPLARWMNEMRMMAQSLVGR